MEFLNGPYGKNNAHAIFDPVRYSIQAWKRSQLIWIESVRTLYDFAELNQAYSWNSIDSMALHS